MKNSLKLSRYNAQYHHDYQDAIFNDYPGKKQRKKKKEKKIIISFFFS
jgi:hypothetical protein